MFHRRFSSLVAVTLMLAASQTPTLAAPLDAIPDSASVVIRLKAPANTIGKVVALVNQVEPQFAPLIEMQSNAIGLLIANPAMVGVDQKQDWWVAVFTSPDAEPAVVFVIPATDADALKETVGAGHQVLVHENHVIYTQDEAAAEKIKQRLGGTGESITAVIDKNSQAVLDGGDLSAFVNVRQITKTYQAQLDEAQAAVDQALGQVAEAAPEMPGMDMRAVFDMYGQMARGILQAVKDTEEYTHALAVDRSGITIEEYARFSEGSATDDAFKSHKTSDLALLDKLPAGKPIYFGAHGDMPSLIKWGMEISASMYTGNEDVKKSMAEMAEGMTALKWGAYAGSVSLGSLEQGVLQMIIALEVDPSEKMRDLSRDVLKAMGTMQAGPLKQEYDVKPDAEKYGKHSADIMTMKQEINEELDPLGIQKKIMTAMYGPDGMTARLVYLPGMMIETVGGGKPVMTEALKAFEGQGTAANEAVVNVRQQLIPKSNLLFLIDLPGLLASVLEKVAESGQSPFPLPPDLLKNLKSEPSYLGFAVAAEPQALRLKAVIPTAQIKGVTKLVQIGMQTAAQFQQMQQQ